MEYIIGFTMTGTVKINSDDPIDALEDAELISKVNLIRYVDNVKYEYIEDEQGKERINL